MGSDGQPTVAVLPTKYVRGANNITDPADPIAELPIEEALFTAWDTDAHFVPYKVVGPDIDKYPRCNKTVLGQVREQGADIVMTALVLDYDNEDHAEWTRESLEEFIDKLTLLDEVFPLLWQFGYFYTTKHGARFVYILDEPCPVDKAEGHLRWLIAEFRRHGVEVDEACKDWTRLYRLPYVRREGTNPTWEEEVFEFLGDGKVTISVEDLGSIGRQKTQFGAVKVIDEEKPDFDKSIDLLTVTSRKTGREIQSKMVKEAKRILKGRECYNCLWEHELLAEEGSRNTTLHKYVGQAVGMLYPHKEDAYPFTMQDIYAFFLEPVMQLEPDDDTPDWTDVLWDHIQRCWAKEGSIASQRIVEEKRKEEAELSLMERVRDGMRKWCDAPPLHNINDDISMDYVRRNLIAQHKTSYYLMRSDGKYSDEPIMRDQLIPQIRQSGFDTIIETSRLLPQGEVALSPSQVMAHHGKVIQSVVAIPQVDGGYIDSMDSPSVLYQCAYRRNPHLKPEFNPYVDEWLHHLGDTDSGYDLIRRWIGWALAFEEGPICALSIVGAPGAGKKLLVEGLGECLERSVLATTRDLTSDTQYGLLESPFLVVNEGWPRAGSGKHPADQFRHFVGGDTILVNRKYEAPVEVRNPVRVIFTANNLDVVHMLTANRNMSPEDRRALASRILHLDVGDKASRYLEERGGMQYTGSEGNRWIRPDGGGESDYIVAKHFLWLHQQRDPREKGNRFLLEGNGDEKLIFDMRTQSGHTPIVIEVIIAMLNSPNTPDGIVLEEGRLWATVAEVVDYYRKHMPQSRERIRDRDVKEVFRGLVVEEPDGPTILPCRKSKGPLVWYELDPAVLLAAAQEGGRSCPKLQNITRKAHA